VIRLAVRVARDRAELVLAELLELAPAGVEESDAGDGAVEYAIYGAPGELPSLPDVSAVAGDALVEVTTSELPDDWSERWKQFHRPVLVSAPPTAGAGGEGPAVPDLAIRPPWEPPPGAGAGSGAEVVQIVIDPGQAFGTGAHATTRLCLELLLALAGADPARGSLIDVGTGSGVIAIAAAKLGFAPVVGLDNEPESVAAAAGNASVNGADIEVRRFDLRESDPPAASVVTANLLRPLLLELAGRIAGDPPAHLLAGGLLVHECDEVAAAFGARAGLRERDRRASGEWAALWLTR
jgi:ribosomal protein L11 methyltransferase